MISKISKLATVEEVLADMHERRIIGAYAIGGAVAAAFSSCSTHHRPASFCRSNQYMITLRSVVMSLIMSLFTSLDGLCNLSNQAMIRFGRMH